MSADDSRDEAPAQGSPAALAANVLNSEAERQVAQSAEHSAVVLPDDLLPGVGAEPMSLRQGVREGGWPLLSVIGLLGMVETLEVSAFAVIAPDIQETLDVSDTTIGAIGAAFGVLFLLGSVPLSSLADRVSRKTVAGAAVASWSLIIAATSTVTNAFSLFMARMGAGLGQSYHLPVAGPMLMDGYPIAARGKVFAVSGGFQMTGQALGPVLAGVVAEVAGGDEGWRWVFVVLGAIGLPAALSAFFLREPRRGRFEMRAVLGEELEEVDELPISLSVAFARLKKIQTFYYFLTGMAAIGFALFSTAIFVNLYLEEEFGLSPLERGLFGTFTILPGFAGVALAGRRSDALYRQSPPRALVFIGLLIGGFGVFQAIGLGMPTVWAYGIFAGVSVALARAAFAVLPAVISTIIPYRLRSRGTALIGIYMFVFGAFFGAVLTGMLSDAFGERVALTVVMLPATLVGGSLMAYGARFVRRDISMVVEELSEEQAEQQRTREPGARIPALQVANLDFSYGKVQVLFDVGFEVYKGETLALLGTNGAGKSTILRVISGLGVPSRGVVRLAGRTVTYADPEVRARVGIVQLAGGRAVFPTLSVDENLRMAGYRYDREEVEARMARVLEMFPVLAARRRAPSGALSGGQQQMLALAMALLHDPEVLLIDELSLGLAPVVVQELLEAVEDLRGRGVTMVIVEQSLNVALAVADRAVFLEKGQIRFEGPAEELARRDDLARAVFLGDAADR
ncbi:ATP-binding protein [Candidatus Poriferisocius sp.]|uniref:ATP-binding protein n=1 Tax=Candidatus Poriferisocius sp. TaxID=3101276 RepID=UPI003B0117E2